MVLPLIFHFGPAILLGSASCFFARPKMAERVKRSFYLYTAVEDLFSLSERRGCPKLLGTAVIISGRFVHAVVKRFYLNIVVSQPFWFNDTITSPAISSLYPTITS